MAAALAALMALSLSCCAADETDAEQPAATPVPTPIVIPSPTPSPTPTPKPVSPEVQALMGLLLKYFNSEIDELDEKNVRITILGDVQGMPSPQKEALIRAMERTGKNTGLRLNIALNYGGRAELVRAAKSLAAQAVEGKIRPEDITEERFGRELYTAGLPDVDLLIRTSGEMRLSNFLPWQTAYAEMVFDSTLWPDFTRQNYLEDIRIYASRDRRFGGVKTGK